MSDSRDHSSATSAKISGTGHLRVVRPVNDVPLTTALDVGEALELVIDTPAGATVTVAPMGAAWAAAVYVAAGERNAQIKLACKVK